MNYNLRFLLLCILLNVFSSTNAVAQESAEEYASAVKEAEERKIAAETAKVEGETVDSSRKAAEEAAKKAAEEAAKKAAEEAAEEAVKKVAAEAAGKAAVETAEAVVTEAEQVPEEIVNEASDILDDVLSESNKSIIDKMKSMSPSTMKKVVAGAIGAWGIGLGVGYIAKEGKLPEAKQKKML